MPGRRLTILYWPVPSVTAVRVFSIRAGLEASTVTPGSTAPVASRTTPAMFACWARAMVGLQTAPTTMNPSNRLNICITSPSNPEHEHCLVSPSSCRIGSEEAMALRRARTLAKPPLPLLRGGRGRRHPPRRSGEHTVAVSNRHDPGIGPQRAILCQRPFDGDVVSHFERLARPPAPNEEVGAAQLKAPIGFLALLVLDVQIDPRMRIGPFHFRDRAGHRRRFLGVVFRSERM